MRLQLPGIKKPILIPIEAARPLYMGGNTLVVKDFGDRLILQRKRHSDKQFFDVAEVAK